MQINFPFVLLALAAFISAPMAHARLGETPEQCRERYGEPKIWAPDKPGPNTVFVFRGILVGLEFLPDSAGQLRVSGLCYRRIDPDTSLTLPLAPREIVALLQVNGAADWPENAESAHHPYSWISAAGDIAAYLPGDNLLLIETAANIAARESRLTASTQESFSGF